MAEAINIQDIVERSFSEAEASDPKTWTRGKMFDKALALAFDKYESEAGLPVGCLIRPKGCSDEVYRTTWGREEITEQDRKWIVINHIAELLEKRIQWRLNNLAREEGPGGKV